MKKGHKKLLFFELILFIILLINSFVSNILRGYNIIILLIVSLIILKIFIGFEKDKHRFTKDIISNIAIILLIYFILYYVLGIFIGFVDVQNYYNVYGLKTFIIPTILTIILKEFLRYNILQKAEGSKIVNVLTFMLFVFLDVSVILYSTTLTSGYNIFMFIALSLMPAISNNILATYISLKVGYKPIIFYLLIIELYVYLLPIIPNPNEYLTSIIEFVIPLYICFRIYNLFEKLKPKEITRDYKKTNVIPIILSGILVIILVYFTSGYFHYFALTIGSGSMKPNINVGDVVIVEKKSKAEIKKLEKGQVLVYKYKKVTVVHRIIDIVKENDKYYFYTKGDNNNTQDNYVVTEDMIIGTTNHKIPIIGYPTVWLNKL